MSSKIVELKFNNSNTIDFTLDENQKLDQVYIRIPKVLFEKLVIDKKNFTISLGHYDSKGNKQNFIDTDFRYLVGYFRALLQPRDDEYYVQFSIDPKTEPFEYLSVITIYAKNLYFQVDGIDLKTLGLDIFIQDIYIYAEIFEKTI